MLDDDLKWFNIDLDRSPLGESFPQLCVDPRGFMSILMHPDSTIQPIPTLHRAKQASTANNTTHTSHHADPHAGRPSAPPR